MKENKVKSFSFLLFDFLKSQMGEKKAHIQNDINISKREKCQQIKIFLY